MPISAPAARVRDHLHTHGASFQLDIQLALALDDFELALAIRELAHAGIISCDDLSSLRDVHRLAANADRDRKSQRSAARTQNVAPRRGPRKPLVPAPTRCRALHGTRRCASRRRSRGAFSAPHRLCMPRTCRDGGWQLA